MPGRSLNVDGGVGFEGRRSKVRKRGCLSSSSSSSSLRHNYRLKRALLVGKKGGSTTPVPLWKMVSSDSPENDKAFRHLASRDGEKVKELPVSARKLAAILWEINGVPSPGLTRDNLEDKTSEVGRVGKKRPVESSKLSHERTDPPKPANWKSRAPASSQELKPDCNLASAASHRNGLMQICWSNNLSQQHCRHIFGPKNPLKDVYDGLITTKELLKALLSCIWPIKQPNNRSLSLVSVMEFELDRACTLIHKLIQGQMAKKNNAKPVLKQLRDEKLVWGAGAKEQDRIIHCVITSIVRELEMQKRIRRKTEKLNEKLGKKLWQMKASLLRANQVLEREKRAREMAEHVCKELAQGIGEDRAKVEELKSQSARILEEVENEREMLQLADMLREERVQMKLLEAKYFFEEKNVLVDKLRNELEAYLKSNSSQEQGDGGDGSPRYEKIKFLEKYSRETFPGSDRNQEKEKEGTEMVKREEEEEDSDNSDLCSIELNVDYLRKSFVWGEAIKKESKRNPIDKSEGRKPISGRSQTNYTDSVSWECNVALGDNELVGFTSDSSKKAIEDEMKRYRMIKDLRDNIVSGSRTASSKDLSSPSRKPIQI